MGKADRWISMFSRAWLAERRWDDNELEWLEAGMLEVAEKIRNERSTYFVVGFTLATILWLVVDR